MLLILPVTIGGMQLMPLAKNWEKDDKKDQLDIYMSQFIDRSRHMWLISMHTMNPKLYIADVCRSPPIYYIRNRARKNGTRKWDQDLFSIYD